MTERGGRSEQHTVVAQVDRERYGVPIEHVHEIIRMQEVTRIPRAPAFLEGVINLRGEVISVIDLRHRLTAEERYRLGALSSS